MDQPGTGMAHLLKRAEGQKRFRYQAASPDKSRPVYEGERETTCIYIIKLRL